jgi:hypothetical protein
MPKKPKITNESHDNEEDEAILDGRNKPPHKANSSQIKAEIVIQQDYGFDLGSDFYSDEILPKLEKLASKGLNNKQIAEGLGIRVRCFNEWCKKYPQFAFALAKYRGVADIFVENALYQTAVGFHYSEQQVSPLGGIVTVQKFMPGNVSAQKFYLTNRMQERYKNKIEQTLKIADDVTAMAVIIRRREE